MAIKNKQEIEHYYKTHLFTLKKVAEHFGVKYATITSWSKNGKWKKGELIGKESTAKVSKTSKKLPQTSTLVRKSKETHIDISCAIYGNGIAKIHTGIGFFDHMLESFTKHSLMDIKLTCKGDLHVDTHHSVEDCGIMLGKSLAQCIYPAHGIERFGNASVVMDEACVECDIDISNRAFLVFDTRAYSMPFKGMVGSLDIELVEEFFRALCFNAGISTHIVLKRGKNLHHIIEAMFKAFAVSLRRALTHNPRISLPSTKGVL